MVGGYNIKHFTDENYDDAANMMRYFVSKNGGTYYIDFSKMNREDINAKANRLDAEKDIMEAAEALTPAGQFVEMSSVFEKKRDIKTSGQGNWFFAINRYRTWSDATVRATQNKDGLINYNMVMSYYLRDNYRWYMTDEKGDILPESTMHLLHLAGLAREYKVEGMEVICSGWSK